MNLSRIFDMANLPPKRTGLDCQIWYSAKTPKHKPRIKVDLGEYAVSINIESHKITGHVSSGDIQRVNKVIQWIDLNKEVLLDYWENAASGSIDNGDVLQRLKKLDKY